METKIIYIENYYCCGDKFKGASTPLLTSNTYIEEKESLTLRGSLQTIGLSSILSYGGLVFGGVAGAICGGFIGLGIGVIAGDSKKQQIVREYDEPCSLIYDENGEIYATDYNPSLEVNGVIPYGVNSLADKENYIKQQEPLKLEIPKNKESDNLLKRIESLEKAVADKNNTAERLAYIEQEHTKAINALKSISLNMPKEEIIDTEIDYKRLS